MREEGGDGHQDGYSEQATTGEAEDGAEDSVEEAEPDGVSGAVEGFAEERAEHHDSDDEEEKGDDLCRGGCGNEMLKVHREATVVPTGDQNSGDQPAQGEELQDNAAHKGNDGGVGQNCDQEAVEEVH